VADGHVDLRVTVAGEDGSRHADLARRDDTLAWLPPLMNGGHTAVGTTGSKREILPAAAIAAFSAERRLSPVCCEW